MHPPMPDERPPTDPVGRDPDALAGILAPRRPIASDARAPDADQLDRILRAATTVPDHGGLRPWRFAVVTGAGRERFGEALVAGLFEQRGPDVPEAMVTKMRGKAFAAPCAVVLIASPLPGSNVPEWEQVASASCTGYAVVLAATSLGLGAVWKSAAVLDTEPVRRHFGLGEAERLLGWVNLGTAADPADVRPSRRRDGRAGVELGEVVTVLAGGPPAPYGAPATAQ